MSCPKNCTECQFEKRCDAAYNEKNCHYHKQLKSKKAK